MPFRSIKLAARKYIDCRAGGKRDVRYDEARMMRRQGIVDCVWEDPKAIVEEEEEEQDNEGENTKLDAGTDL